MSLRGRIHAWIEHDRARGWGSWGVKFMALLLSPLLLLLWGLVIYYTYVANGPRKETT